MQDKMQILLKQVKLDNNYYQYFDNGILDRIVGNKNKDCYKFLIKIDKTLPVLVYENFSNGLIKAFPTIKKVFANFEVEKVDNTLIQDYFKLFIKEIAKEHPLIMMLIDNTISLNDNKIVISVANKEEERQINNIKDYLLDKFVCVGYKNIVVDTIIDKTLSENINSEINESMNLNIELTKEPIIAPPKVEEKKPKFIPKERKPLIIDKDKEEVVAGRVIDGDEEIEIIKNIITPMTNVTIEGTIFGNDVMETKTGLRIMTLKITDYTDSIYGKMFINTEEEFSAISKGLKKSSWFKFRGGVKDDQYSKELTLNIRDINIIDSKEEEILDEAPVKRVELHAHTMMSQMAVFNNALALTTPSI